MIFQGCLLTINDKEVFVKGAVLAMLADTLAAHSIGGFKVGVVFSLRKCRNCLATKDTMSVRVSEDVICVIGYNHIIKHTLKTTDFLIYRITIAQLSTAWFDKILSVSELCLVELTQAYLMQ